MKKILVWILVLAFIVFCASMLTDFLGTGGAETPVFIPVGSNASNIAKALEKDGVIRNRLLFTLYIRKDAAHLTAGMHNFTASMGYKKALEELKKIVPLTETVQVTIPEGYELREIATLLEEKGLTSASAFSLACKEAHTRYDFLPADGNAEGYLFPATYDIPKDSDATAIVDMMLKSFQENMMTDAFLARSAESGQSFHAMLTLASIIEREAALDTERETISSVFHNRLRQGMHLESCATVQYILAERKPVLSIADTQIASPYNTYLHPGLPPAPIASPGIASMNAALYPAETDYLFFVANGSGGHTFSTTYAEHLAAQQ